MSGWLLDTNVVTSLMAMNGAPSVRAWARRHDERQFFLSVLTLAECDKGIAQLPDGDARRDRYALEREALAMRFAGRILPLSNEIVRRWGALAGRFRRDRGHPPPVVDALMAATAIEKGLLLATRNLRDFAHSGATVVNPWDEES